MEKIEVAESNKNYSSKDGVLFNKSLSALIYYPKLKSGTEYTVPSGVSRIEESSFFAVPGLQTITIPASVTSIGNNAFYYCNIAIITIDKPKGSISGAPWGAMRTEVKWQE